MPISSMSEYTEQHWQDVLLIIKEALDGTSFQVELVSDANEVGVIQKRIVQNLYDSQLVICDVSGKNPNVMFELGMRLAFDKPAIIIKDSVTSYSFDTAPIEHLTYPRDLHYHTIQAFKQKLREKALATYEASQKPEYTTFLKHFGEFVIAAIEAKPVSKEDFILEELSQLRTAVREMTRSNRSRVAWVPVSSFAHPELQKSISEADFVKAYLLQNAGTPSELRSLDSEAFTAMMAQYLIAAGLANASLTESDRERVRRELMGAVNASS